MWISLNSKDDKSDYLVNMIVWQSTVQHKVGSSHNVVAFIMCMKSSPLDLHHKSFPGSKKVVE